METEIVLFEKLADNLPVEIIQIQDTQVAPGLMDIFNDLEGSLFSQCPFVLLFSFLMRLTKALTAKA